jgi:hypothetical protein
MNTTSKAMKAISFALAFALVSNAVPAQAWTTPKMFRLDNTWPFRDKDKPREGTPVKMVGTWTDTVLTQAGQKPQRGFGGRILFYDKEDKKPILVDGQLVIYAFNEAGRDPADNKPTRRYVFPADQVPQHMSKSEMGASYSFWLPWDEAGGPKTEVSLICRFEPKGGAVVTGEQTRHILPGPLVPIGATAGAQKPPRVPDGVPSKPPRQTLESLQAQRTAEQQARLASFEAPAAGAQQGAVANGGLQTGAASDRHLTAATISLPQNYQLPDTATLNSAMQAANYQQAASQMNRAYQAVAPAPMNQQMYTPQPYVGVQAPQQQLPASAPAMFPGVQAIGQSPVGSNTMAGQIQQQVYMQPVAQPPMSQLQQYRQPQLAPQTWPQQAPNQMAPAAGVSSLPAVQYR